MRSRVGLDRYHHEELRVPTNSATIKDNGHDTENFWDLKRLIANMITQGKLKEVLADNFAASKKPSKKRKRDPDKDDQYDRDRP